MILCKAYHAAAGSRTESLHRADLTPFPNCRARGHASARLLSRRKSSDDTPTTAYALTMLAAGIGNTRSGRAETHAWAKARLSGSRPRAILFIVALCTTAAGFWAAQGCPCLPIDHSPETSVSGGLLVAFYILSIHIIAPNSGSGMRFSSCFWAKFDQAR